MPKFSIVSLLALTFWIAATIASVSLIQKSADAQRWMVMELLTASFSFAVFGFAIYALYSSIFGAVAIRPLWIGCSIVCWLLILVEPFVDFGFTSICDSLASYLESRRKEQSIAWLSNGYVTMTAKGIASVWRSSLIPLLGCIGGILAQSIAHENRRKRDE